jgi:hypothetical protein
VHRAEDHRLGLARLPEEGRDHVIDLDEVAHLREALRRHQRRVLGEELRVVGARTVDVRARQHDHLPHAVRLAVLEQT